MSSVPAAHSTVGKRGAARRLPTSSGGLIPNTVLHARGLLAGFGLAALTLMPALVGPGETAPAMVGGLVVAALALALAAATDVFARDAFASVGELVRALAGAAVIGAVASLILAWRWPEVFSPLLACGFVAGIAFAGRVVAASVLIPAATDARPRTLLFTAASGSALGEEASRRLESAVEVVGRVAIPGSPKGLVKEITARRPSLVLVDAPVADVGWEVTRLCTERAIRVLVLVRPPFWLATGKPIVRLGGLPWVSLAPFPLAGRHVRAKRALDVALLLLAAPVLVPVLTVLALVVAFTSRGGVLYCQRRVGLGGRSFTLLKLRTMRHDAERDTGPVLAEAADPRTTCVGAFLRRLRLDELPQLWNVLRGEMSLVGPRPERPELAAGFTGIPAYDCRHLLRPGLTGLAQLVGGYSASAEDKLRCDLVYLSSRSLRLDLRLIAATALDFLRGFPDG